MQPVRLLPSRIRRCGLLCLAVTLALAGTVVVSPTSSAVAPSRIGDPAVVSQWNTIALSTFAGDTTKAPVESFLYVAFTQAAVYDAAVGIAGRYKPYRFHAHAPRGASVDAAVAAAAHRILVTYSPYAAATLDAALASSLAGIPDGAAKTDGVAFGERAADRIIKLRTGDGRNAPITFDQVPAPGVWRPTPPAFAPMAAPWLAFVKPLLVHNVNRFDPGPPPSMTSRLYTRDFNEAKAMGSATMSSRSADQTATALFFSGNATAQYNTALRDQIAVRGFDGVDAAHLLAQVTMSQADAVIGVWRSKYDYGFWRPVTAIRLADTDGNPATLADPIWTPLLNTPNYPEYISGYSAVTGSFTRALADALGTRHLHLTLTSTAVPNAQRTYESGAMLDRDVINARVWLGIHFRFSDTLGVRLGHEVADSIAEHNFGRTRHHH